MNYPPKWTWVPLRRYALDYLGETRLPKGLRAELRTFLGQPAYPPSVHGVLKRYWKRPWVL